MFQNQTTVSSGCFKTSKTDSFHDRTDKRIDYSLARSLTLWMFLKAVIIHQNHLFENFVNWQQVSG
jgi:hypothetical protein